MSRIKGFSELYETTGALCMLVVNGEAELGLSFRLESGHDYGQRFTARVFDRAIVRDRCPEPIAAVINDDWLG